MHIWYCGTFVKRGFLYGPLCPIYGFGGIILILINDLISKKSNSIIIKFITMSFIITVFEYLASLVFELIFGIRWWDYTNEFLNLNGRVCLMFSMLWGIGGVIFIKLFYNPIQNIIKKVREKIPNHIIRIVLIVLSTVTLVDFVLSIIKYASK